MNEYRSLFQLDPDVTFLNHGSFGAAPTVVFNEYQRWQRLLERQPVEFIARRSHTYLKEARNKLASFLGCEADELLFVTNVTMGLNIIAASLRLPAGSEILSTDLEYGATVRMWQTIATRNGWRFCPQKIKAPFDNEQIFADIVAGHSKNTKVLYISHITSFTSLLMPVVPLIKWAKERGIITVIDGAHAPGQIDINLKKTDADFYVGNNHKWLMSPKGSAFIHVKKEQQPQLKPLILSWGRVNDPHNSDAGYLYNNFEYSGTSDISAWLATGAAVDFYRDNNWRRVSDRCHGLLADSAPLLQKACGSRCLYENEGLYKQMITLCLPRGTDVEKLQGALYHKYRIEAPFFYLSDDTPATRISVQGYNSRDEIELLTDALKKLLTIY